MFFYKDNMMEIQLRTDGLIAILTPLTDSINASISTAFKGQVMDIIYQKHDLIILNLSEIDFIDSSGLGALISILKTITKNHTLI